MKRLGNISVDVETLQNFREAFYEFSKHKRSRLSVQEFEEELEKKLLALLDAYQKQKWKTSEYEPKIVTEPKVRVVNKLPVKDHVIQHAALYPVEPRLRDKIPYNCPAGTKGRGTHFLYRIIKRDIYKSPQQETAYCAPMDIHHYFLSIEHNLLKAEYRLYIKDRKLLAFIDEVVDSYPNGVVLGVKLTQLLGQIFLIRFDYLAMRCFDILKDPERYHYWQARYVSDMLLTCRSQQQARMLTSVQSLNERFDRFVRQGLKHYYRFMDNIFILHEDKVFLRLMVELTAMFLARDWKLSINKSWNIHRTCDGIDYCGQVIYADHARIRKRTKQALCRQVAKLRKKGYNNEQIRLKAASRLGLTKHADTKNLLKKIGMKTYRDNLGIRRGEIPFPGMSKKQKRHIGDVLCKDGIDYEAHLILIEDYKIDKSTVSFKTQQVEKVDEHGNKFIVQEKVADDRLALKFRFIDHVEKTGENDENGEPIEIPHWQEEVWWLYSGAEILITQAREEWCFFEKPFYTVVAELKNKFGKTFYKFI